MKTVMVVDDSSFMRGLLKKLLCENKYNVIAEAWNGIQAVEKYIEYSPDVVLMDITMPKMNGLDALKEILRIDPKANVVMLSSLGSKFNMIEALQLGAKDFVVKPYFNNLFKILRKISEDNSAK